MPEPFDFLLGALAVWRMASMLHREAGPDDIFGRVRRAIGIRESDGMLGNVFPDTWLGGMFACVWCLSVNLGILWALLFAVWPAGCRWASLPFALSALAILVERHAHRG